MKDTLPSLDEMARQVDEVLLPAFVLGLVNIAGPIADQDKAMARRMLEVTQAREALAAFLRSSKVHSDLRMLLVTDEGQRILDGRARQDLLPQVDGLKVSSSAEDISDELWRYVQEVRRPYVENILHGILPEK